MDAAGFERPLVVGNSLGGWISMELARRGRVRGVVGLSPAGLMAPREATWARMVLNSMREMVKGAPAVAPLLRTTVGRTLLAGPSLGRPWRADPDDLIEQAALAAATRRAGSRRSASCGPTSTSPGWRRSAARC